jgi:hypothetical protein
LIASVFAAIVARDGVIFDGGILLVKSFAYKAQAGCVVLPIGWLCPYPAQEMLALLRLFFLQEFVDDLFYVAVLAVYGVVQLTHIIVGYFSGEFIKGSFYFRMCG